MICISPLTAISYSVLHHVHKLTMDLSSSPLNGQAAELWDNDFEEFKRNVIARHQDLTDEDME